MDELWDEPTYKVALLGQPDVGKTSIFRRVKKEGFNRSRKATGEQENFSKTFDVGDQSVKLEIWDTGGIERHFCASTNLTNLYRDVDVALFIYSIDDVHSLHLISTWEENLSKSCGDLVPKKFLVGNKIDLESQQVEVDKEKCRSFAMNSVTSDSRKKGKRFVDSFRTSALENIGIDFMFSKIAGLLLEERGRFDSRLMSQSFRLTSSDVSVCKTEEKAFPKGCPC